MRGLEISKSFFLEWGLPFIEREFPGLKDQVAIGCFAGSQALDADDHLSRDHGWGPTFTIYLDGEYSISDFEIVSRISEFAPTEHNGIRRRGGGNTAVRLIRTDQFFEGIFFGPIPESDIGWICRNLDSMESQLYFLRHGSLFHDGNGYFSSQRDRFSKYPDDVLRLRMASCSYRIAHFGEYNFCQRLVERADPIPMQIALGSFTDAVMKMHFYIERDFAPYWKWLAHEFRRRKFSKTTEERLEKLPLLPPEEQAREILLICDELRQMMITRGIVDAEIDNPYRVPWFFRYLNHLKEKITDEDIRKLA